MCVLCAQVHGLGEKSGSTVWKNLKVISRKIKTLNNEEVHYKIEQT